MHAGRSPLASHVGFGAVITAILTIGCGSGGHDDRQQWKQTPVSKTPPATRFSPVVHLPFEHLGMNTGKRDAKGKVIRVRCATCHGIVKPKPRNAMATKLKGFHKSVNVRHGTLTCRSCHAPPSFESFRLSSGQLVPYRQVMELCGQCHSRQRRDYSHGVHGGMMGYWDLNSGPQHRNHCLDCHSPHRPAIGKVMPAPRARYRFTGKPGR